MRLSSSTLTEVRRDVARFEYDRASQAVGIVHFGIGAFHRAHQAWYTDRAMDAGDRNWAIVGVSLRSSTVADQMNPQDGLYTVAERGTGQMQMRVVGAVREVIVAGEDRAAVIARLAAPTTRIVSFTITEKGYGLAPDGALDPARAGAGSIYGLLAEGLRGRRDAGLPGLTLLSCDNLAGNGALLARSVGEYFAERDPALGRWIDAECSFPSAMVDRIVPATTAEDLAQVEQGLGLRDEAAVVTEPFSQWVIEDRFPAGRPAWQSVGVQVVDDVAPYEAAKLRMLNGAHSALAYLGLMRRHTFVHQAVADPSIRPVVERLMRQEAAASLVPAPGQDLGGYADALLDRFANPALNHRLSQIAMDGSQKIPQRWLPVLAFHGPAGRSCEAALTALAAWLRHLRGDNGVVDDPLAETMRRIWAEGGVSGIVDGLFGEAGLLSSAWRPSAEDRSALMRRLSSDDLEDGVSPLNW